MTQKDGPGTLADAAKRGEYVLVEPFDYMILGFLPEEGQLFAGLYPMGETVTAIAKKFTPEQQKALTGGLLAARLQVMRKQRLVVDTHAGAGGGGKRVWQRTKLGTQVLNKWKGANGGSGSGGSHA